MEQTLTLILLLLNENIMDVLIPLFLLLEIKLTKLWLCILLNHIACPQFMYGCEIWPLNSVNIGLHEIDIIWNNGFRRIFNCCWRESVKPLQFYCRTLPISHLIGEIQLLFYRRLLCSDNIVLRTLAGLVRFEMLGIAAK